MNKLTAIKIKYDDGTYSDEIPISVLSENVEWDSTHTLVDVLGSIDVDAKGTIQAQIDKLSNNTQLTDVLGNIDVSADGTVQDQIKKLSNEKVSNTQLTDVLENVGTLQDQIDKLSAQGAGAHNSIYRGKDLGTSVTYKQWAAINAGTFDDLYIGDYWVIGGVTWRIAAFDYFYNCGDTNCTTHHVVLVPDTCLYNAQMHTTSSGGYEGGAVNTTEGGYVGTDLYKTGLEQAKTTINSAFGSAHVLKHRQLLTNGVSNGSSSSFAWFDSTVELMNEVMVYGTRGRSQPNGSGYDVASSDGQLPLFAMNHNLIHNRNSWWLRDVCSASHFASVHGDGFADYGSTSDSRGVRPAFSIKS